MGDDEKYPASEPDGGSSKAASLDEAEAKAKKDTSPSETADGTAKECPITTLAVLVVNDLGEGVEDVEIKVTGPSSPKPTAGEPGHYDCGEVEPGDYKIVVEKVWHLGPGQEEELEEEITLVEGDREEVPFLLEPVDLHMYLDADRDGTADPTQEGMDGWEWGPGKKGAIVLCNNDDDHPGAAKGASDNEDAVVNDHNDADELAPIEFRNRRAKPPDTWKGKLEILDGNEDKIRIFEARPAGSKEVLGKTEGAEYEFPKLDFKDLALGIEATRYAGKDWENGEVKIKFILEDTKGNKQEEEGVLRVAPWMMLHHGIEAEDVYVVQTSDNATFRGDLGTALPVGVFLDMSVVDSDRWAQDVMEIGCSTLPAPGGGVQAINAIVRSAQTRSLGAQVKTYRDRDVGYEEPVTLDPDRPTQDSFGNLEVAPPCTAEDGTQYPYGRIYYGPNGAGETFNPDMETFLEKQVVQKPFAIDTSWLAVGHVDEIITFVPDATKRNGKDFKALVASPLEAYRILEELKAAGHGAEKLLINRWLEHLKTGPMLASRYKSRSFEITVENFLRRGFPDLNKLETAKKVRDFNDKVQDKIDDAVHDKFPKELGYKVPRAAKDIRAALEAIEDARGEVFAAEGRAQAAEREADAAKASWESAEELRIMAEELFEKEDPESRASEADAKAEYDEKLAIVAEKEADVDEEKAKLKALEDAEKAARLEDDRADVVRVPVLFLPHGGTSDQAIAMTAGTVNMLVLGTTCIFPQPYGPEIAGVDKFQEALETKLTGLGATPKAVDDWYTYHALAGEVHCGTNTRRKPPEWKWWEYEPK